jgi:hypothetical protein
MCPALELPVSSSSRPERVARVDATTSITRSQSVGLLVGAPLRVSLRQSVARRETRAWETSSSYLQLCRTVKTDLADLRPRDLIDIQSFLWVQGAGEYA